MSYVKITKPEPEIILVTAQKPEPSSPEDFQDYLTKMLEIYRTHQNIVVIYDTSQSKFLKAEYRIKLGNWLKTNKELIHKKVYGVAYVTTPISTIMMHGIFLVQKPLWRNKIFTNLDHAFEWAHQLIEEQHNKG